MAKAKAKTPLDRPHQVVREQLVKRFQHVVLGEIGGRGHQIGLERLADHRSRLEHGPYP